LLVAHPRTMLHERRAAVRDVNGENRMRFLRHPFGYEKAADKRNDDRN
jgi:hypothetical protein